MSEQLASGTAVISLEGLEELVRALSRRGYRVVGPSVRDGAVVYEELETAAELPIGWGDAQEAGTYRLVRRDDEARFGYAVGPHSWKQFLQPPHIRLWRARRNGDDGRGRRRAGSGAALRVLRRARLRPARGRDPGSCAR